MNFKITLTFKVKKSQVAKLNSWENLLKGTIKNNQTEVTELITIIKYHCQNLTLPAKPPQKRQEPANYITDL